MRTSLVILATALSLAGFVAASSAASASGSSSGGSASAGSGSGGGGGSAHGGGGGAHGGGSGAHGGGGHIGDGGHIGGGYGGGGQVGGAHGERAGYSYTRPGTHGSYTIVGYRFAGLGRGDVAARDGRVARNTLPIGPRTGSAASARRVTDHRVSPVRPHKPRNCREGQTGCSGPSLGPDQIPVAFCPPRVDERGWLAGCPGSSRSTARARPVH